MHAPLINLKLLSELRAWVIAVKIAGLTSYAWLFGEDRTARWLATTLDCADYRAGRPTVLCLSRPLFEKDIAQLRQATDLNWIVIKNEFLGHVQRAWVPKAIAIEAHYQRARNPEHRTAWARMEHFGCALLNAIASRVKIDAILLSHIDYWQGESVRMAAQSRGLPVLALCREHMNTPKEQETVRDFYTGFRFEGDAVAVFGEQTKQIFINSGACRPEQIWVTGAPRFDVWRALESRGAERDHIVLLSFADPDYRAVGCFEQCLKIFTAAAHNALANASSCRFVIKAKNFIDYRRIARAIGQLPLNMQLTHSMSLHELFPRSRLVIGFNSLAVVEALLSDAEIAVPCFADADRDRSELLFSPDDATIRRAIAFPQTPGELASMVDAFATREGRSIVDGAARAECLGHLLYWPTETTASNLVADFVLSHIESARKARSGGLAPMQSTSAQRAA
jgi:hypothetical protein